MLKFGTVGPTFPPIERIPEQAKRLEERGYDSIWFPDHLMGWYPQSIWTPDIVGAFAQFSPHVFFETTLSIALAASTTTKLLIGSSVTEPIRHHPVMLAQSYATLEHITRGRVILGIGAGEKENCEPYGLKYENIVSRLEEALQIIRLCWNAKRDELLNFEGKFWTLKDAVFELPPLKGRPPIWIGGAGPRMAKLVGTYADGWLPFTLDVETYKNRLQIIKEAARKARRNYEDITKALYTSLIIDENHDECIRIMQSPILKAHALATPSEIFEKHGYEHPLGKKFYGLTDFVPSRLSKEQAMKAIEKVPLEVVQDSYLWGTPEEVIEKIDKFAKAGMEHFIVWNETYFGDPTKVSSSYRCISQVMKYFKESK
ncbi:MAG: LLM class flavin-dependent oxidoreductase [Candidatus Jordarchaeaceae archaeon]